MYTTNYVFITDPGHGWLEVPLAEIRFLGIADKISAYSYQKGDMAYLEEDCDASVFLEAKEAAGQHVPRDCIIHTYDENTPIRNYRRFA